MPSPAKYSEQIEDAGRFFMWYVYAYMRTNVAIMRKVLSTTWWGWHCAARPDSCGISSAGAKRGKQRRHSEGTFEEDIYNIDTGWNENVFSVAAELLSQMEGWEVKPGVEKVLADRTKSQKEADATGDGEI